MSEIKNYYYLLAFTLTLKYLMSFVFNVCAIPIHLYYNFRFGLISHISIFKRLTIPYYFMTIYTSQYII